jgi:hypothetical protein
VKRPDFFIIGAPKCGTTSLAHWLGQHREVYFSPVKEPHFFNDEDELRTIRTLAEYEALFSPADGRHKAVGEGSTWYLFAPEAVVNIERYTGGKAKYVVCLRNPVDMACSLHSEMYVNGNEPVADFEKAWRLQADRAAGRVRLAFSGAPSHLQYARACALGSLLSRLYDRVPRERVLTLFLDDIAADGRKALGEVAAFLGIGTDFSGIDFAVRNSAKRPASPGLVRMIAAAGALKRALRVRAGLGVLDGLSRLNTVPDKRPAIGPRFRAELTDAFLPEIERIEALTGRDLGSWR